MCRVVTHEKMVDASLARTERKYELNWVIVGRFFHVFPQTFFSTALTIRHHNIVERSGGTCHYVCCIVYPFYCRVDYFHFLNLFKSFSRKSQMGNGSVCRLVIICVLAREKKSSHLHFGCIMPSELCKKHFTPPPLPH